MELYRTSATEQRQAIQCQDCGHAYYIARGQRSSRCEQCGNIAFYSQNAEPLRDLAQQQKSPIELLQARVMNRIQEKIPNVSPASTCPKEADLLEAFQKSPDGLQVQNIVSKFQVEWQLWAKTVKNFSDPAYHMAYLTVALSNRQIAQASSRYLEHRKAMLLSKEDHWQVEISELMLSRIETLALMPVNMAQASWMDRVPHWMLSPLWESMLFRFGFLVVSFITFVRILMKMFPHTW